MGQPDFTKTQEKWHFCISVAHSSKNKHLPENILVSKWILGFFCLALFLPASPPKKKKSTQAKLLPLDTAWTWFLIYVLPSAFVSYNFGRTLAKWQCNKTVALPFFTSWCVAPACENWHWVTAFKISADRLYAHDFYGSSPWAFKHCGKG